MRVGCKKGPERVRPTCSEERKASTAKVPMTTHTIIGSMIVYPSQVRTVRWDVVNFGVRGTEAPCGSLRSSMSTKWPAMTTRGGGWGGVRVRGLMRGGVGWGHAVHLLASRTLLRGVRRTRGAFFRSPQNPLPAKEWVG